MDRKHKVLFLSTQFPSPVEPFSASFNRQQIEYLSETYNIVAVVPVYWFPFKRFVYNGKKVQNVFQKEVINNGVEVHHPRLFYCPGFLRNLYGFFYFLSVYGTIRSIYKRFQFETIYVTWAFPDAFAAMLLAKVFKKPFVVKVHGSDINVGFRGFIRKYLMRKMFRAANKIFTVSEALKTILIENDVDQNKICVLYNGIDLDRFKPLPQCDARHTLDISANSKIVLFLGHLIYTKGVFDLLEAFEKITLKNCKLFFVGEGSGKEKLKYLIADKGLGEHVRIIDECLHEVIPFWINAADVVCLPSYMEGLPNVILETLACGRPIVATHVGGISEIFKDQQVPGKLIKPKNIDDLRDALEEVLLREWNVQSIRHVVAGFSWKKNVALLDRYVGESLFQYTERSYHQHEMSIVHRLKSFLKTVFFQVFMRNVVVWHGKREDKYVALTFDDGPDPQLTPIVLDILSHYKIKATFFLIGKYIEQHKEICKRIIDHGHCIGTHTYDHDLQQYGKSFSGEVRGIVKTEQLLNAINNNQTRECKFFRPPQGKISLEMLLWCMIKQKKMVLWSIDSSDYRYLSDEIILQGLYASIREGDIILFHDNRESCVRILPQVIDFLEKKSYRFVGIDDIVTQR